MAHDCGSVDFELSDHSINVFEAIVMAAGTGNLAVIPARQNGKATTLLVIKSEETDQYADYKPIAVLIDPSDALDTLEVSGAFEIS